MSKKSEESKRELSLKMLELLEKEHNKSVQKLAEQKGKICEFYLNQYDAEYEREPLKIFKRQHAKWEKNLDDIESKYNKHFDEYMNIINDLIIPSGN